MPSANEEMTSMFRSLLREFSPLAGAAAPWLANTVVPRGSPYDVPFLNQEGSPDGSLSSYANNYMQTGAYMSMIAAQNAVRDQFYTGMARSVYGQTPQATAMAQQWASNYGVNTAYHMLDPLGVQNAMAVAAESVGMGMRIHSKNPMFDFEYGQKLTSIYADPKNGLITTMAKNPQSFGGFGLTSGMQIAAELQSAGMDLTGGRPAGQMEEQTKKVVEKVKEVTKALMPLKDLLGEDVPRMMQLLESMAGRNIVREPGRIADLTGRLTSTLAVTGATLSQYASIAPVFQQGTKDPSGISRAVLGSGILAMDYLQSTANASAIGVTTEELQDAAARNLIGTSRSAFVTNFQRGAALYALDKGLDATAAAKKFSTLVNMNKGMDPNAAILSALQGAGVKGVNSLFDLQQADSTNMYANMASANVGSEEARQRQLESMKANAESYLAGYAPSAAAALRNMTPEQYMRILANGSDAAGAGISRADADAIQRMSIHAGIAVGVLPANARIQNLRGLAVSWDTLQKNAARASQAAAMQTVANDIGTKTSGISGVLDVLMSDNNSSARDLIGGFFGEIKFSAASKYWSEEKDESAQKEAGDNIRYALQNALGLTPYQNEQFKNMMDNPDANVRKAAMAKFSASRELSGYLSKMGTDKEKQAAIDSYLSAKAAGGKDFNSRNWTADREVEKSIEANKDNQELTPYANILKEVIGTENTGVGEAVRAAYMRKAKEDGRDESRAASAFEELSKNTSMERGAASRLEEILNRFIGPLETIANKIGGSK